MSEAVKELKNLRNKRAVLEKEITVKAKELFKTTSKELFEKYDNLVAFSWTQYTPYFNDGDECVFSSGHTSPGILFTTTSEDDKEDFDSYAEEWSTYRYYNGYGKDKILKTELTPEQHSELKTGNAVVKFLENFDDDDMRNMFGDHQKITVTVDGVESEDYSHE